jgi:hypothetical protein
MTEPTTGAAGTEPQRSPISGGERRALAERLDGMEARIDDVLDVLRHMAVMTALEREVTSLHAAIEENGRITQRLLETVAAVRADVAEVRGSLEGSGLD